MEKYRSDAMICYESSLLHYASYGSIKSESVPQLSELHYNFVSVSIIEMLELLSAIKKT